MTHYVLDPEGVELSRRATIELPAAVQYGAPHPSRNCLYIVSSDGGLRSTGDRHFLTTLRIDDDGSLQPFGDSLRLPSRPIHVTVTEAGSSLLIAYNSPSRVTVHPLDEAGQPQAEVAQHAHLDFGSYAHQVRHIPASDTIVVVARGHDPRAWRGEAPGSLNLFNLDHGQLIPKHSIVWKRATGFGPRHLDFHPNGQWVYVALERQNEVCLFDRIGSDIAIEPRCVVTTLHRHDPQAGQALGAIHVHPNGRFLYVANRSSTGRRVSTGGENTIAVFALDSNAKPSLIQSEDARGFEVRTFSIDSTGQSLIAASSISMPVETPIGRASTSAGLSLFRIDDDGRLTFVRRHPVDTQRGKQFWASFV